MCVTFFGLDAHPDYPFWIAFNRDEYFERASLPAHEWSDASGVVGGRDLERGGTWLGIRDSGRVAFLTNYKGPPELVALDNQIQEEESNSGSRNAFRSRGELTVNFLNGNQTPYEYVKEMSACCDKYRGFSLIVGSLLPGRSRELCFLTNCNEQPNFQQLSERLRKTQPHLNGSATDGQSPPQKAANHSSRAAAPGVVRPYPSYGRLRPGRVYGLGNDRLMCGEKVHNGLHLLRRMIREDEASRTRVQVPSGSCVDEATVFSEGEEQGTARLPLYVNGMSGQADARTIESVLVDKTYSGIRHLGEATMDLKRVTKNRSTSEDEQTDPTRWMLKLKKVLLTTYDGRDVQRRRGGPGEGSPQEGGPKREENGNEYDEEGCEMTMRSCKVGTRGDIPVTLKEGEGEDEENGDMEKPRKRDGQGVGSDSQVMCQSKARLGDQTEEEEEQEERDFVDFEEVDDESDEGGEEACFESGDKRGVEAAEDGLLELIELDRTERMGGKPVHDPNTRRPAAAERESEAVDSKMTGIPKFKADITSVTAVTSASTPNHAREVVTSYVEAEAVPSSETADPLNSFGVVKNGTEAQAYVQVFRSAHENGVVPKTIFVDPFSTERGVYGTRSQTVIIVDREGKTVFREDAWTPAQGVWTSQDIHIQMNSTPSQ